MPEPRTVQLAPVVDFSLFLQGGELVAFNVGPDAELYIVIALGILDYSYVKSNGARVSNVKSRKPQTYRVIAFHNGVLTLDLHISGEPFNIHDVQPLPNNEILLASGRSSYRGSNDFDRNGRIYSTNGEFLREILLGDGVNDLQATSSGIIWTSFFDEGVFGNFGWNNPVGASGLIAWDAWGEKLYEYQPIAGLDEICDCYALNVEDDENTWLYYYTEFPLVHLKNRQVVSWWELPVHGGNAFAVLGEMLLFEGGYDHRNERFVLLELGERGTVRTIGSLTLLDEAGEMIAAEWLVGRGDGLFFLSKQKVYQCDVLTAL